MSFNENDKPGYDIGREGIQEQARSSADIMANNPPIKFNYQQQEEQKQQPAANDGWFSNPLDRLWSTGSSVLKTGGALIGTVGFAMQ